MVQLSGSNGSMRTNTCVTTSLIADLAVTSCPTSFVFVEIVFEFDFSSFS